MKQLTILILAGIPLWGADAVNTPVAGLVREQAALRMLTGLPGALDLGAAVMLPETATLLRSAPRQEWLLLDRNGEWLAFDWQRGTLFPLGRSADHAAFSNSGHEAVFATGSKLRVVTGLPAQASIAEYNLPDGIATVEHLAVNDGATQVALWGEGRLIRWEPGGTATEQYRSNGVLSLTFVAGANTLLVADLHQNAVLSIDPGQAARQILGAEDGLDVASAVWAGSQSRIAVVSAKRELLWTYDGREWRFESIPGVTGIEEMQLRDTLLLSGKAAQPLRMHAFGTEQRSYEVPRGQTSDEEAQQ